MKTTDPAYRHQIRLILEAWRTYTAVHDREDYAEMHSVPHEVRARMIRISRKLRARYNRRAAILN